MCLFATKYFLPGVVSNTLDKPSLSLIHILTHKPVGNMTLSRLHHSWLLLTVKTGVAGEQ